MSDRMNTNRGGMAQGRSSKARAAPGSRQAREVHHSHATSGLSIAAKVALMCGLGAVVPLIICGAVVYSGSKETLCREADACGVNLARAIALPGAQWWEASHGTLKEAVERVTRAAKDYSVYLDTKYGLLFESRETDEMTNAAKRSKKGQPAQVENDEMRDRMRQEEAAFRTEFENAKERNQGRLRALTLYADAGSTVPAEVVDVCVVEAEGGRGLVRANPSAGSFALHSAPRRFTVSGDGFPVETDAEIVDGQFEDGGAARSYSWPIRDAAGRATHRVLVFLSMAPVEESLGGIARRLIVGGFITLLIVGAAAYSSARWLTRRILVLVDDIDIIRSGHTEHRTRVHTGDEIGILARTVEALARHEGPARPQHTS
ncbi:MAG: HAMP domain-containing protein [Planctomycetota bacterium]